MTRPEALGLGAQEAALVHYPDARRVWDFARGIYFGIGFAHSSFARSLIAERASDAGFFDRNGDLRFAAINTPRLTHDPVTGAPLGLLIEAQATNQIPFSAALTEAVWEATGVVCSTGTLKPDDQTPLTRLTEDASTGIHRLRIWQIVTVGAPYTFSALVRGVVNPSTTFRIIMSGDNIPTRRTEIHLGTGAIVESAGGVEPLGGGLYRIWASGTATGSGLISCALQITRDGLTYAGDSTTAVEVGEVQLESALRPTSIIRSTGAITSRVADHVTVNFGRSGLGKTRGSLLFEGRVFDTTAQQTLMQFDDGTSLNRVFLTVLAGGELRLRNRTNMVQEVNILLGTVTAGQTFRVVIAYDTNDYAGSLNGAPAVGALGATALGDMTKLGFGAGAGLNQANVLITSVACWNARLSNATLEALSA